MNLRNVREIHTGNHAVAVLLERKNGKQITNWICEQNPGLEVFTIKAGPDTFYIGMEGNTSTQWARRGDWIVKTHGKYEVFPETAFNRAYQLVEREGDLQ